MLLDVRPRGFLVGHVPLSEIRDEPMIATHRKRDVINAWRLLLRSCELFLHVGAEERAVIAGHYMNDRFFTQVKPSSRRRVRTLPISKTDNILVEPNRGINVSGRYGRVVELLDRECRPLCDFLDFHVETFPALDAAVTFNVGS